MKVNNRDWYQENGFGVLVRVKSAHTFELVVIEAKNLPKDLKHKSLDNVYYWTTNWLRVFLGHPSIKGCQPVIEGRDYVFSEKTYPVTIITHDPEVAKEIASRHVPSIVLDSSDLAMYARNVCAIIDNARLKASSAPKEVINMNDIKLSGYHGDFTLIIDPDSINDGIEKGYVAFNVIEGNVDADSIISVMEAHSGCNYRLRFDDNDMFVTKVIAHSKAAAAKLCAKCTHISKQTIRNSYEMVCEKVADMVFDVQNKKESEEYDNQFINIFGKISEALPCNKTVIEFPETVEDDEFTPKFFSQMTSEEQKRMVAKLVTMIKESKDD